MEYKGHAIRDKEKSIGDPDEIQHFFGQGWVKLKFNKDNAYPFVYNKKLDKIIFGSANSIHNNIFTSNNADKLKEMGLDGVDNVRQLRYCCGMDDDTEEIDRWYEENKKYIDETICGRIWYNAQDDFESWDSEEQAAQMAELFGDLKDLDSSKCYVANWNEVAPNDFKKVLDNIVKHFSKEHNKKIKSYIAIDNNGEPIELEVGNNDVKIDKRSSDHEKEIEHAWQYHTDTSAHGRAKKRELTHGWIKSRDEHFQKTRYNHTDSKTAAEFHHKFTKRYDAKSGKYVWGEKIGDSLQTKTVKDYICEAKNGCFINFVNVVFFDNKPIAAMKNLTIGEVDEHTAKITINKNNKPYFEIYSKENDKDIKQLLQQCAGIITQTDDDFPMGEIISKDETNNSFVYELDNKKITIYFNKL